MTNGEHVGSSEQEPQVSFIDYLKAEREKVIEAQREAIAAVERAREAGNSFQAELNKLRGKKVIISGSLTGEEVLFQDGYGMDRTHRRVEDLEVTVNSVFALDSPNEGFDRNRTRVYMRQDPPSSKYRHHDVMANLFELTKVEIIDPPEVPASAPTTVGGLAVENTVAVS